jgi:hypothetical protein
MTARWIQVLGLCLGMFLPSRALAEPAAKPLPPAPAVWAAALAEPLPPALAQALAGKVRFVEAGPIQKAAEQVVATRAALASLRCSEVMPSLRKAGEALLDEVPVALAQPIARELFGLMLLCADRIGDAPSAERAASFLSYQTEPLPTDLALLLPRYLHATAFGPPRAPVRVESDPSGATVIRNAQVIGKTPLLIDGGRPDLDVVYVELPGMRKVRRPLGAGESLFVSLRPEDRLPLLLDQVASLPVGSETQAAALTELAGSSAAAMQLGGRLLVFGPKLRDGAPVASESLVARVFDLERRTWLTPMAEVAIGPAPAQAETLVALLAGTAPKAAAVAGTPAGTAAAAAVTKPAAAAPSEKDKSTGSKLPFAKTKWYTWVVAGGVAALIGGLLIAERFSSEKITVTATH